MRHLLKVEKGITTTSANTGVSFTTSSSPIGGSSRGSVEPQQSSLYGYSSGRCEVFWEDSVDIYRYLLLNKK